MRTVIVERPFHSRSTTVTQKYVTLRCVNVKGHFRTAIAGTAGVFVSQCTSPVNALSAHVWRKGTAKPLLKMWQLHMAVRVGKCTNRVT